MLIDISASKQPSNITTPADGTGGWPTYYGTSSDPVFNITCTEFTPPDCTVHSTGMTVHAPGNAQIQGGLQASPGADRHMTIIDQVSNTEFDLFHVQTASLPNTNGTIITGQTGYTAFNTLDADGRAAAGSSGEGNEGRYGNLAGRVRLEELKRALDPTAIDNRGYINHALAVVVNCTAVEQYTVYPADPGHTLQNACSRIGILTKNPPVMGARIHLNMGTGTADGDIGAINALKNIPEWKKVFLRTLIKYGAIVNDLGTTFYFAWQLESGNQYTSMGVASDPWLAFGQSFGTSQDWGADATGLVRGTWLDTDDAPQPPSSAWTNWTTNIWSHLEVLDPCVSLGNCSSPAPAP